MALHPPGTSWWQRNRIWLALLVPLLAAAIASSSWAWFTLYRPFTYHQPQRAVDGTVHLVQPTVSTGHHYTIDVTMHLDGMDLAAPSNADGWMAAPGQQLWRSTIAFEAAPDLPLTSCTVTVLDAEGREYLPNIGVWEGRNGSKNQLERDCVPQDAPGPALIMGKILPDMGDPRPARWTSERLWSLPAGVMPDRIRVAWTEPAYAEFDV